MDFLTLDMWNLAKQQRFQGRFGMGHNNRNTGIGNWESGIGRLGLGNLAGGLNRNGIPNSLSGWEGNEKVIFIYFFFFFFSFFGWSVRCLQ